MSTIKELAETCGVSEQAIRKWCARNQVAKDVAQRYCDRCCDVDSSDNFLFFEEKIVVLYW